MDGCGDAHVEEERLHRRRKVPRESLDEGRERRLREAAGEEIETTAGEELAGGGAGREVSAECWQGAPPRPVSGRVPASRQPERSVRRNQEAVGRTDTEARN